MINHSQFRLSIYVSFKLEPGTHEIGIHTYTHIAWVRSYQVNNIIEGIYMWKKDSLPTTKGVALTKKGVCAPNYNTDDQGCFSGLQGNMILSPWRGHAGTFGDVSIFVVNFYNLHSSN